MRLRTLRAFAIFAAILVVLTPTAFSNEAAAISKSYADGPAFTTEWSDSKYQDDLAQADYNGSTQTIELKFNSQSDTEGNFNGFDSKDADIATSSSQNNMKNGPSENDQSGALETYTGFSRQPPASAYSGGTIYFMGDDIHSFNPNTGAHIANGCDAAANTAGQPRGLADGSGFSGSELTVLTVDTVVADTNFYEVDLDTCSFNLLGTFSQAGKRGMATHESDSSKRYFIDGGGNQIEIIDLDTGNVQQDFLSIPTGQQRGLDVIEWPDGEVWFLVGYTTNGNSAQHVRVFRKSDGQELDQWALSSGEYNPVWNPENDEKRVWTMDDNGNGGGDIRGLAIVDLWAGDGAGTIKYSRSLSGESGITNHDLTSVTWAGEAPNAYKGTTGQIEFQVKNDNNNWETLDTVSEGTGSFSNTISDTQLGSRFDSVDNFEYRVIYGNNYKIKGTTTTNPKVTSVSWDYEWYSTPGTIESTELNTQDVKNFSTVEVDGTSGGSGVQLQILDRNQTVVWDSDNHGGNKQPSATFDISDLSASFSTRFVYVRVILETTGGGTPGVTGWRITYDGNPSLEVIEYAATVTKQNTTIVNDTSVTSEIGSTDTFYINETNQTVDSITWKVNGQIIKSEDVSGTGPFSASYTWSSAETGINSLSADLSNRNGTTSHTWAVEIPSPTTVKYGTVDIIRGETQAGTTATENVTVDFPGDNQTITTDIGTQFDVAVDVSNQNVTYNLTMSVSDPVGTSVTATDITGDYVNSTLSDALLVDKSENFDGEYAISLTIENTNNKLTTWDVRGVYKQQVADSQSTPNVEQVKIPTAVHRGESFAVSSTISSEITSIREVWLRVEHPDGTVTREEVVEYFNTAENESVSYSASPTLDATGTYEFTVVGQNYDLINGTSRTFVVDVRNSPPESQLTEPPTQVDANRSFRLDWSVSDPEGDAITETGVYLVSPSGVVHNFTDDQTGSGQHTITIGPGNVTNPGLWAVKAWARDDKGGFANSSREILEVVSLQEYAIKNTSVALWNGTETSTLHAGREIQVNADITPNVSNTLDATVYVNLETQSGTLVSELFTATSVTLKNGTTTNLTDINNGSVNPRLSGNAKGTYVIEFGVVSDEGDSTFRVPVDVLGITTGEIESTSLNKKSVFPPEFLTVVSTIRNDGEQTTKYNYTVRITQNGTTHVQKSVNSTVINPSDTASAGLGFQIPKTLVPGDYTVEISIASPNHTAWDVFDQTSLPITIEENRQAEVDEIDLGYESGVVQGYVIVENDGNVPLSEGSLRLVVIDANTDNRVRVEDMDVSGISVGAAQRKTVNFNFSAQDNSTYFVGIRYNDSVVSDDAFTQFATAPQPSMEVVDIDGPEEVIQGDNATYAIKVKNNGDVKVDSTSLVVRLQTGQGDTIAQRGIIVDATFPDKSETVDVTLPIDDPALLGRSAVSVVGQAHSGNNTTQMLPRDEEIFVSAPGFIISGDSSFSGLTPGESFTVTETFLVVGRPDAAIDVQLSMDTQKLELISGRVNQTITSGSSISWTFLVKEPVNGRPIRIIAQSASQSKAKDIAVSTTGSTGIIGNFDQSLPDEYDEFFPNTYMATVLPGMDTGVHYLLQWLIAIALVAVIEFADITTGLTFLQKHGGAIIAAGWTSGFIPEVMVVFTGLYAVGLWIESRHGLNNVKI